MQFLSWLLHHFFSYHLIPELIKTIRCHMDQTWLSKHNKPSITPWLLSLLSLDLRLLLGSWSAEHIDKIIYQTQRSRRRRVLSSLSRASAEHGINVKYLLLNSNWLLMLLWPNSHCRSFWRGLLQEVILLVDSSLALIDEHALITLEGNRLENTIALIVPLLFEDL